MITYLEDTSAYESYDGTSWVGFGGGGSGILQVVSTAKTDTFTTTSSTFTTVTGLSATITPSSTTSKILMLCQITYGTGNGDGLGFFKATRGGTDIYRGDAAGSRTRTVFGGRNTLDRILLTESGSIQFLDSPSSTSALTYRVEVAVEAGGTVYINRSQNDSDSANRPRGASSITLMEVAS
jgi:hypothetical protein